MSGKKDTIIGFASNYRPEQIALWVLSIEASGFKGKRILGSYDLPKETKEFAESYGFDIIELGRVRRATVIDRFEDMPKMISKDMGRIIATDVADVIFMEDPSDKLDLLMKDCSIIASPEYIKFIDEAWNRNNMLDSFGQKMLILNAYRTVCNAGVITAEAFAMLEISKGIYDLCSRTRNNQSDQSAYNIILGIIDDEVKYASPKEAWGAHLAVHYHPEWVQKLSTKYDVQDDGSVLNEDGNPYSIVHQYNRSKELTKVLQERFL